MRSAGSRRSDYVGGSQSTSTTAGRGDCAGASDAFDGVADPETLAFEYDPVGRQTAVVHTDGTRIENVLTANGWLAGIPGVIDAIEHDARGLVTRIDYANGVTTTTEYGRGPGSLRHRRRCRHRESCSRTSTSAYDAGGQLISRPSAAPGGHGRAITATTRSAS